MFDFDARSGTAPERRQSPSAVRAGVIGPSATAASTTESRSSHPSRPGPAGHHGAGTSAAATAATIGAANPSSSSASSSSSSRPKTSLVDDNLYLSGLNTAIRLNNRLQHPRSATNRDGTTGETSATSSPRGAPAGGSPAIMVADSDLQRFRAEQAKEEYRAAVDSFKDVVGGYWHDSRVNGNDGLLSSATKMPTSTSVRGERAEHPQTKQRRGQNANTSNSNGGSSNNSNAHTNTMPATSTFNAFAAYTQDPTMNLYSLHKDRAHRHSHSDDARKPKSASGSSRNPNNKPPTVTSGNTGTLTGTMGESGPSSSSSSSPRPASGLGDRPSAAQAGERGGAMAGGEFRAFGQQAGNNNVTATVGNSNYADGPSSSSSSSISQNMATIAAAYGIARPGTANGGSSGGSSGAGGPATVGNYGNTNNGRPGAPAITSGGRGGLGLSLVTGSGAGAGAGANGVGSAVSSRRSSDSSNEQLQRNVVSNSNQGGRPSGSSKTCPKAIPMTSGGSNSHHNDQQSNGNNSGSDLDSSSNENHHDSGDLPHSNFMAIDINDSNSHNINDVPLSSNTSGSQPQSPGSPQNRKGKKTPSASLGPSSLFHRSSGGATVGGADGDANHAVLAATAKRHSPVPPPTNTMTGAANLSSASGGNGNGGPKRPSGSAGSGLRKFVSSTSAANRAPGGSNAPSPVPPGANASGSPPNSSGSSSGGSGSRSGVGSVNTAHDKMMFQMVYNDPTSPAEVAPAAALVPGFDRDESMAMMSIQSQDNYIHTHTTPTAATTVVKSIPQQTHPKQQLATDTEELDNIGKDVSTTKPGSDADPIGTAANLQRPQSRKLYLGVDHKSGAADPSSASNGGVSPRAVRPAKSAGPRLNPAANMSMMLMGGNGVERDDAGSINLMQPTPMDAKAQMRRQSSFNGFPSRASPWREEEVIPQERPPSRQKSAFPVHLAGEGGTPPDDLQQLQLGKGSAGSVSPNLMGRPVLAGGLKLYEAVAADTKYYASSSTAPGRDPTVGLMGTSDVSSGGRGVGAPGIGSGSGLVMTAPAAGSGSGASSLGRASRGGNMTLHDPIADGFGSVKAPDDAHMPFRITVTYGGHRGGMGAMRGDENDFDYVEVDDDDEDEDDGLHRGGLVYRGGAAAVAPLPPQQPSSSAASSGRHSGRNRHRIDSSFDEPLEDNNNHYDQTFQPQRPYTVSGPSEGGGRGGSVAKTRGSSYDDRDSDDAHWNDGRGSQRTDSKQPGGGGGGSGWATSQRNSANRKMVDPDSNSDDEGFDRQLPGGGWTGLEARVKHEQQAMYPLSSSPLSNQLSVASLEESWGDVNFPVNEGGLEHASSLQTLTLESSLGAEFLNLFAQGL